MIKSVAAKPSGFPFKAALSGAALGLVLSAGGAMAASVTFINFTSTNSSQLHPDVVIDDSAPGEFSISATLTAPEFGDLANLFVDFGTGWAAGAFANLSFVSDAPNVTVGQDFSYEFSEAGIDATSYTGGVCDSNTTLSGLAPLPLFEGVACHRSTGSSQPNDGVNPVLMRILDPDGVLALSDFQGVAMRYKSASNDDGSDKLFSSTTRISSPPPPPLPPIPLPAAGWLLLGALGLGACAGRRKKAA